MQHGDLGVPVSVMDMAVVSAVLAFAGVCCPPLGSVRRVLLSPHILLARFYCCEPFFKSSLCACACLSVRERKKKTSLFVRVHVQQCQINVKVCILIKI